MDRHLRESCPNAQDHLTQVGCDLCSFKTFTTTGLATHVNMVHGKKAAADEGKTSAKPDLDYVERDAEGFFACPQCPLGRFSRRDNLKRHVNKVHGGGKNYQSDMSFANKVAHSLFGRAVDPNDSTQVKLICNFCVRSFGRKDSLKRHLVLVHEMSKEESLTVAEEIEHEFVQRNGGTKVCQFTCEICDKQFVRKDHLKVHLRGVHKITELCADDSGLGQHSIFGASLGAEDNISVDTFTLQCPICSRKFDKKNNFGRHLVLIHGEAEDSASAIAEQIKSEVKQSDHHHFVCEVCQKSFSRKDHLKRHIEKVCKVKSDTGLPHDVATPMLLQ